MADTAKLRRMIRDFKFHAAPTNTDGTGKCDIRDLNRVIDRISLVLNAIVDELESGAN